MTLKDIKQGAWKEQEIEIFAYPNKRTGFEGFMKTYKVNRIPKKYEHLEVVYWASEYRPNEDNCNRTIIIADVKEVKKHG